MNKLSLLCLLFLCSFFSFAGTGPLPQRFAFHHLTTPVSYTITDKATVLYISNSCSGMINDAVAGEGKMTVSVLGRIQNGQLFVQVKVDYRGMAFTTVEGNAYQVDGHLAASESTAITSEPVTVFVKGSFKLEAQNKASNLFVSDIGYITVYPDGSVTNHIFDPRNDPDYCCPKLYCAEPRR